MTRNLQHGTKRGITRGKNKSASPQLQGALALRNQGYSLIPIHGIANGACTCGNPKCKRPGKHPIFRGGVSIATRRISKLNHWFSQRPNANVGIALGANMLVLDIDPKNGGDKTFAELEAELGSLPRTPRVLTGGGGEHRFFEAVDFPIKRDTAGKLLGSGVDILTAGSIVIAPPSRHASGKSYSHDRECSLLSELPLQQLPDAWKVRIRNAQQSSRRAVAANAQAKIPQGRRNDTLTRKGGYLVNKGLSDAAIAECLLLINQTRCEPPLEEAEVRSIAESVLRYRTEGAQAVHDSREYRALAMLLAEHFEGGERLRHVTGHGYHIYTGTHWKPVDDSVIEKWALKFLEELPAEGGKLTTALSDVMRLLSIKQSVDSSVLYGEAVRPIINCQNGEVWIGPDGEVDFREHSPSSGLLHCLPVKYDPAAKSPRYNKALRQIFQKSKRPKALARHWNELCGYLIQITRDIPLILLLLGNGSNGKTVLVETVSSLIGEDYVFSGTLDQLEKNRFLIGFLRGKLIFVDDDVRAGAKLPDGVLKKLSEAKLLTGELKNKNAFQFINRALPILLANNEPTTSDLSYGLKRRIMVIPFEHRFVEGVDMDRALWRTIRDEEMSGILNCYVRGLQRLRKRGSKFKLPMDVVEAKQRWYRHANPLQSFLHECTSPDLEGRVLVADLFDTYNQWARDNGITYQLQRNTMNQKLKQLEFNVARSNRGAVVIGLSLAAS